MYLQVGGLVSNLLSAISRQPAGAEGALMPSGLLTVIRRAAMALQNSRKQQGTTAGAGQQGSGDGSSGLVTCPAAGDAQSGSLKATWLSCEATVSSWIDTWAQSLARVLGSQAQWGPGDKTRLAIVREQVHNVVGMDGYGQPELVCSSALSDLFSSGAMARLIQVATQNVGDEDFLLPPGGDGGVLQPVRRMLRDAPECRTKLRDLGFIPFLLQLVRAFPRYVWAITAASMPHLWGGCGGSKGAHCEAGQSPHHPSHTFVHSYIPAFLPHTTRLALPRRNNWLVNMLMNMSRTDAVSNTLKASGAVEAAEACLPAALPAAAVIAAADVTVGVSPSAAKVMQQPPASGPEVSTMAHMTALMCLAFISTGSGDPADKKAAKLLATYDMTGLLAELLQSASKNSSGSGSAAWCRDSGGSFAIDALLDCTQSLARGGGQAERLVKQGVHIVLVRMGIIG